MRFLLLMSALISSVAAAQGVYNMGDIVVVPDPSGQISGIVSSEFGGSIFPSIGEQFCRAAYNAMRASAHPDVYDGVIAFSGLPAINNINNVWQGAPVRSTAKNIGRDPNALLTAKMGTYNSNKLSQCVFMGTLGKESVFGGLSYESLPASPDGVWKVLGSFESETGIEMMGHEYGHHWLMAAEYDLGDGRGKRALWRATRSDNSEDPGTKGEPNQHYSAITDSRSVMYGSCITDLGHGGYHLGGCVRKYSHIDQYLMGLRGVDEVTPMMVLENPAAAGKGEDGIAMSTGSSGKDVSGYTRYNVGADAIVRAMGARDPAHPQAKHCWRVAFIVVLAPGQTALAPDMYAKVERYRQRWSPWFSFATDSRGTMDTRVIGEFTDPACIDGYAPNTDGGYVWVDAGMATVADAGVAQREDGGTIDPVHDDAGVIITPARDAGVYCPSCDLGIIRPGGCGCGSASGLELLGAMALAVVAVRRRFARAR